MRVQPLDARQPRARAELQIDHSIARRLTREDRFHRGRVGGVIDAVAAPLERARQRAREIHIVLDDQQMARSEEHTSELQSLMRISYAVFCLKKKQQSKRDQTSQL